MITFPATRYIHVHANSCGYLYVFVYENTIQRTTHVLIHGILIN